MSVKKLSATEAMDLYQAALSSLPEISSLHFGFDEDKPVIIATVDHVTDQLDKKISQIAPNAQIKLIEVGVKKPISAAAAARKYGPRIRRLKAVASVDLGTESGQAVLRVRAYPLTEGVKAKVRSVAPDAPLDFRESQHKKHSVPSILEFLAEKLRGPCLLMAAFGVFLVVLSPLYSATDDIKFALSASTSQGVVVASARPMRGDTGKDDITQEVTIKFGLRGEDITFTQNTMLYATVTHFENLNADPYHKGAVVTVSYDARNPQATARIFDRLRFWVTLSMYFATVVFVTVTAVRVRNKWQEW